LAVVYERVIGRVVAEHVPSTIDALTVGQLDEDAVNTF
jgi:hypothetical protein